MKIKWFDESKIQTVDDLKKMFRNLCFANHPDRGGSTADMQEINAEYDFLFAKYKDYHRAASGETYQQESHEAPEEFREIIEKIISCMGIEIEICGCWIWVTGDTKPNKDTLKDAGFRWSKKKSAWYWHSEEYHKMSKNTLTLEEIRSMYGSEKVSRSDYKRRTSNSALLEN